MQKHTDYYDYIKGSLQKNIVIILWIIIRAVEFLIYCTYYNELFKYGYVNEYNTYKNAYLSTFYITPIIRLLDGIVIVKLFRSIYAIYHDYEFDYVHILLFALAVLCYIINIKVLKQGYLLFVPMNIRGAVHEISIKLVRDIVCKIEFLIGVMLSVIRKREYYSDV